MTLTSRSLMWVGMIQHRTSGQYLTSGQVWTTSIQGFRRYSLLKTLTENFNQRRRKYWHDYYSTTCTFKQVREYKLTRHPAFGNRTVQNVVVAESTQCKPVKLYSWSYSGINLTLALLNPDMSCLCKKCRSRSVGLEANWSGSALFAFKYVNLYLQFWSSNLIGWKLEMVGHLNLFSRTRVKILW